LLAVVGKDVERMEETEATERGSAGSPPLELDPKHYSRKSRSSLES
jgi:hypothetical protein